MDEGAAVGSVFGCPPHEQAAALESRANDLAPEDYELLAWILDRIEADRRLGQGIACWCPLKPADVDLLGEALDCSADQVRTRISILIAGGYLQPDIDHRTGELLAVFPCLRSPPWFWPLWPRRYLPDV